MKKPAKWLRLQLRGDQKLNSRYVIIHTHYSIYQHLVEQGYTIGIYEPSNYKREEPNAVIYIQTDSEDFLKSCCRYYEHDFTISYPDDDFQLPQDYRLRLGSEMKSTQMAY